MLINLLTLNKLTMISIYIKIFLLIILGLLLYLSSLFITEDLMIIYFITLTIFVISVSFFCFLIIGKNLFIPMLTLWWIGTLIYFLVSIPIAYSNISLSPYILYINTTSRILFVTAHPIRLLGTFSIGLIFIKITSPIEFLRWGRVGLYVALLLRTIQYSTEKFTEIRIALLMQNKWPDNNNNYFQFNNAILTIKYAPILIAVTFRNIIQWFPWAWISFNKLNIKINGGKL